MTINANTRNSSADAIFKISFLLFIWVMGLALGYMFCEPVHFSLMRSISGQSVSIVGSFVCIFLPLILSVACILFEKPILLSIVCFIKAVAFGFSSALISYNFTSGLWLIRFLFLFSDSCYLPCIMFLWLKCIPDMKIRHCRLVWMYAGLGAFIAAAEYIVVSPILERLF